MYRYTFFFYANYVRLYSGWAYIIRLDVNLEKKNIYLYTLYYYTIIVKKKKTRFIGNACVIIQTGAGFK